MAVRGSAVVSVMGDVDVATAPALEHTLRGAADDQTHEVIVDLTGCTFLDSQGLGALVATKRRLERSNRRLALVLSARTRCRSSGSRNSTGRSRSTPRQGLAATDADHD